MRKTRSENFVAQLDRSLKETMSDEWCQRKDISIDQEHDLVVYFLRTRFREGPGWDSSSDSSITLFLP
jgi:hypothetical protein